MKSNYIIYGVFDNKDGTCLYVGRTQNLESRTSSHLSRFKHRCIVKVIRRTSTFEDASRIENQVIRAYRARGQAARNKYAGKRPKESIYPKPTPPIRQLFVRLSALIDSGSKGEIMRIQTNTERSLVNFLSVAHNWDLRTERDGKEFRVIAA